jgi:Fe-S-cluster formation regulator IscX/YfhJ
MLFAYAEDMQQISPRTVLRFITWHQLEILFPMFEERPTQRSKKYLHAMRKDFVDQVSEFVQFTSITLFVLYHQR